MDACSSSMSGTCFEPDMQSRRPCGVADASGLQPQAASCGLRDKSDRRTTGFRNRHGSRRSGKERGGEVETAQYRSFGRRVLNARNNRVDDRERCFRQALSWRRWILSAW